MSTASEPPAPAEPAPAAAQDRHIARDILKLGWPTLIGQLAVMGNGVIDIAMAGHLTSTDLVAVGLGASIYATVYVSLMGAVFGMAPVLGEHFGAGRLREIGPIVRQGGIWLGFALLIPGLLLLSQPDLWMAIAQPAPEVAEVFSRYMAAIAVGLPAAILFRVFYVMNSAVARPKVTMAIQLVGLGLKAPLNALFMYGAGPIAAMGGAGCGVSTAVIAWTQLSLMLWILHRDPFYQQFNLKGSLRPKLPLLKELAMLGIPISLTYLIDVSSFTFMAVFVARLGTHLSGAHQIVSNLAALSFMLPLAVSNAASVLTSHAIGAGSLALKNQTIRVGFRVILASVALQSALIYVGRPWIADSYTNDPHVIEAAVRLMALLAIYTVFDGIQCYLGVILRAQRITTLPMVVYALSLWGVGLSGGVLLGLGTSIDIWLGRAKPDGLGVDGFWIAASCACALASVLLSILLWRALKREARATAHRIQGL